MNVKLDAAATKRVEDVLAVCAAGLAQHDGPTDKTCGDNGAPRCSQFMVTRGHEADRFPEQWLERDVERWRRSRANGKGEPTIIHSGTDERSAPDLQPKFDRREIASQTGEQRYEIEVSGRFNRTEPQCSARTGTEVCGVVCDCLEVTDDGIRMSPQRLPKVGEGKLSPRADKERTAECRFQSLDMQRHG
jgi:hypothetical protein